MEHLEEIDQESLCSGNLLDLHLQLLIYLLQTLINTSETSLQRYEKHYWSHTEDSFQSGSIINSWASATPPTMLDLSLRLAKKVNCTSTDMNVIAKCLRSVPAHLVQAEADNISGDIGPPMTFAYVPVSSDANFFQVFHIFLI